MVANARKTAVRDSSQVILPSGSPETVHSNGFLGPWLMRGFLLPHRDDRGIFDEVQVRASSRPQKSLHDYMR